MLLLCATEREAHSTLGGHPGPTEEVVSVDAAVRHLPTSRSWAPNAPHRPGSFRTAFQATGPWPESQALSNCCSCDSNAIDPRTPATIDVETTDSECG